jgi:TonB-dependent receptor
MFNKNRLSAAIVTVLASAAGTSQVFAQDNNAVEEVIVTGIRASVQQAMDIKRDAAGVVDAISAEDMGKFPDTNLAESLQRITGVSISRTNGEGSEVTVRGFGGEFNMITLNGRTMPAANVYGGGSGAGGTRGGSTRAFDFANIASEGVSAVEVYKTGRASVATGGIGASINIKTARPLDNPGLNLSVGVKALSDSTNRTGADITPELSGIVSWTDDEGKFGVGLSLSSQQRDSGSSGVQENNWNIGRWDADNWNDNKVSLYSFASGVGLKTGDADLSALRITDGSALPDSLKGVYNAPADGQLYGRPNDIRYVFSDVERTRTNAQLTFQFAPNDNMTMTADYTFAENDLHERRGESTSWLANNTSIDAVVFSNDEVATPIYIHETDGPRDQGYEQQLREQTNTLKSLGLNLEWAVNDSLTLNFDFHDSSMESLPSGPGNSGEIAASIGAPVQISHWLDFSGDMPLYNMAIDDGIQGRTNFKDPNSTVDANYKVGDSDVSFLRWEEAWVPALDVNGAPILDANGVGVQWLEGTTTVLDETNGTPIYRGNNNGILDAGDIGSQVVRVFYAAQVTDTQQFRVDGSFEFDNGKFDFGVESRSTEMAAKASDRYMAMGDWGIATVGDIPVDLFEDYNLSDFPDYNSSSSYQRGFKGNAEDIAQSLVDRYVTFDDPATPDDNEANGYVLAYNPNLSLNDNIQEDISALYAQFSMSGMIGKFEANILAGFRYETTDVTSSSDMLVPTHLQWQDNNDFNTKRQSAITTFKVDASYDNLLPSIDFDISFTDDIKGRASYSKTIARTGFGNLASSASNFGSGGGSVYNGAQPTATVGNPELIPLESNNFDLSAEWYFAETSYASVGFFEKRVSNFVGTEQTLRTLSEYGTIRDVTSGPRVEAAAAALTAAGISVDDTSLFVATALLDNGRTVNEYVTARANGDAAKAAFEQQVAFDYDIDLKDGVNLDQYPETVWMVSKPVNNREAKLYGSELAVQHFFGDTGFGVMANYTIVRGDVKFEDAEDPSVAQFALLGLSDSANLVLMYENFGVQARLAYNWRDEYLSQASRGSSRNPVYVEAYSQIDMNVSYEVMEGLSVFFEGLNLTGENIRTHGRSKSMVEEVYDLGARYALGARYTF